MRCIGISFGTSTSLLTKVFFEAGQVIVLKYGSYKNRQVAAYSYDRTTHVLKAEFSKNNLPETLMATVKIIKGQLIINGEMNKKNFFVQLKKR